MIKQRDKFFVQFCFFFKKEYELLSGYERAFTGQAYPLIEKRQKYEKF